MCAETADRSSYIVYKWHRFPKNKVQILHFAVLGLLVTQKYEFLMTMNSRLVHNTRHLTVVSQRGAPWRDHFAKCRRRLAGNGEYSRRDHTMHGPLYYARKGFVPQNKRMFFL